ncbi:hypothetical protein O0L34_g18514 [Tuta absoluta]|nr:hypothetical protein O0L34_g18514 [Tuta absoluta]
MTPAFYHASYMHLKRGYIQKKVEDKIRTTQRAMERSITNIKKIDKIRHTKIREKTKITDALTHALKLKWKWAGHVARLPDRRWTIKTTTWAGPAGKRSVGRPYKRWSDDIAQAAGKKWPEIAKDRQKWQDLEEAFTQIGIQEEAHNTNDN